MNQIIITKGILFYNGTEFVPSLKNAKLYHTYSEANRVKKNLPDTEKVEVLNIRTYKNKIQKEINGFLIRSQVVCKNKAEYKKHKDAVTSKNKMQRRLKVDTLTVFKCQSCKFYHIGTFDGYSEYYSNLIKDLKNIPYQ